jgi:hypothetical protein
VPTVVVAGIALLCLSGCAVIDTVAGTPDVPGYTGDNGPALSATLHDPHGVAFDAAGNAYVADADNHAVRKITPSGIITTVAGKGAPRGYSGDGGPATAAQLNYPVDVTFDTAGNLYIADRENYAVRKVDTNGIITTAVGGNGQAHSGDGGPATEAQLWYARSVAFDTRGNLYIADRWHAIRKVAPNGIITTVAGGHGQGYSGDGGLAVNAQLNRPRWAEVDPAGNIYIADYNNHAIRKVNTAGIITTIAGGNGPGTRGDGGPAIDAQLWYPTSLAFDPWGNLVLCEHDGDSVRRITPDGIIRAIAGANGPGFSGDGGLATSAQIDRPSGVEYDAQGRLWIGDRNNEVIRRVTTVIPPLP